MPSLLARDRLSHLLAQVPRLTIGLVGDLFLDRYLDIAPGVREMSIETGLEAYQVARVRNSPGALGTVINNLAALGVGTIRPLTVIGDDGEAYDVLRCLRQQGVITDDIIQDPQRQTPTYNKPMKPDGSGACQELNRLDLRARSGLSATTVTELLRRLKKLFLEVDGLIVLDQIVEVGWGVINAAVRDMLPVLARQDSDKLILVDSRAHIGEFRAGTLKPNRRECCKAAGLPADTLDDARAASAALVCRTRRPVFCTLGEEGILLTMLNGHLSHLPAYPVAGPIDIVGAGDSATAAIATSLLAGATHEEAGQIANLVASITIQQIGTTGTASPEQVLRRWEDVQSVCNGATHL